MADIDTTNPRPTAPSCSHGLGNPAACIDCMADGPVAPPRKPWTEIGSPFTANFEGICPCTGPISIGEIICRYDQGERTVYTHRHCQPR